MLDIQQEMMLRRQYDQNFVVSQDRTRVSYRGNRYIWTNTQDRTRLLNALNVGRNNRAAGRPIETDTTYVIDASSAFGTADLSVTFGYPVDRFQLLGKWDGYMSRLDQHFHDTEGIESDDQTLVWVRLKLDAGSGEDFWIGTGFIEKEQFLSNPYEKLVQKLESRNDPLFVKMLTIRMVLDPQSFEGRGGVNEFILHHKKGFHQIPDTDDAMCGHNCLAAQIAFFRGVSQSECIIENAMFQQIKSELVEVLGSNPLQFSASNTHNSFVTFATHYPQYSVSIFIEMSNGSLKCRFQTSNYLLDSQKIYIYYDKQHFALFKIDPETNGILYRPNKSKFRHCVFCNDFISCATFKKHNCRQLFPCNHCCEFFPTKELLESHKSESGMDRMMRAEEGWTCGKCHNVAYTEQCYKQHELICNKSLFKYGFCQTCYKSYGRNGAPHRCGYDYCFQCKEYYVTGQQHRHVIKNNKNKNAHLDIICYDIEAQIRTLTNKDPNQIHKPYLLVAHAWNDGKPEEKDKYWIFKGFDCVKDFVDRLCERSIRLNRGSKQTIETILIAHNGSNYDCTFVANAFYDKYGVKAKTVQTGKTGGRIMCGGITWPQEHLHIKYWDSRNHWKCKLSDFGKIFNIQDLIKGTWPYFMPYLPDWDSSKKPPLEYYDLEQMNDKAYKEFETEYEEMKDFNFMEECIKYCAQDVFILSKAMQAYGEQCAQKYPLSKSPFCCPTAAGMAHDIYLSEHYDPEKFPLKEHRNEEDEFIREGYCGGLTETPRTQTLLLPREWVYERMESYDVCSLYPSRMLEKLPYGDLEFGFFSDIETVSTLEELHENYFNNSEVQAECLQLLQNKEGMFQVDFYCPDTILFPILPVKHNGKLLFLKGTVLKKNYTKPELLYAMKLGYKLRIIRGYIAPNSSTDIFRSYILHFMKQKILASDKPKDYEAMCQKLNDMYGVELNQEPAPDPVIRAIAKLMMNSLYGKFAERRHDQQEFMTPQQFFELLRRQRTGDVTINSFPVFTPDQLQVKVSYVENQNTKAKSKTYPLIAAYVTAMGRVLLHSEGIQKICDKGCGHNIAAMDTDSIMFRQDSRNRPNIELASNIFGKFEDEVPAEHRGVGHVCLGPKSYIMYFIKNDSKEIARLALSNLESLFPKDRALSFLPLVLIYEFCAGDLETKKDKVRCKGVPLSNTNLKNLNFAMYLRLTSQHVERSGRKIKRHKFRKNIMQNHRTEKDTSGRVAVPHGSDQTVTIGMTAAQKRNFRCDDDGLHTTHSSIPYTMQEIERCVWFPVSKRPRLNADEEDEMQF